MRSNNRRLIRGIHLWHIPTELWIHATHRKGRRCMQNVLAAIDSEVKQYASSPLFRLLDVNEQRVSSDKFRGMAARHRQEDAGHDIWLYRDMDKQIMRARTSDHR